MYKTKLFSKKESVPIMYNFMFKWRERKEGRRVTWQNVVPR